MDELISRREAIKWFFRPYSNEESYSNLDVWRALKAIPTIDAIPVEWLRNLCTIAKMEIDDEMFIDWLIQTWQQEQEAR